MIGRLAAIAALFLIVSPAMAGGAGAGPAEEAADAAVAAAAEPPPSPQEIARARAYADSVLAQANAGAWFENVTDSDVPRLRHRLSGLECAFPSGEHGNVLSVTPRAGLPAGDDVSCSNNDERLNIQTILTATRFGRATTLDEALGELTRSLRAAHRNLEPWRGSAIELGGNPQNQLPEMRSARFTYREGGRRFYVRADVVIVGDWVITSQAIGDANEDVPRLATELIGAMIIDTQATQVRDHLAGRGAPATAQAGPGPPTAPAPPAAPPSGTANAARVYADRLIERAGADGLMVNATGDGATPAVRHVRSGMVCRFSGGDSDRIAIYSAYNARPGDDVGCNTSLAARGFVMTLYATRYPSGTLDEHFRRALSEMEGRYSNTRPWTGRAAATPLPDGAPAGRDARLLAMEQGTPVYTRVGMVEVAGWTLLLRFTGPQATAEAGDEMASRMLGGAVREVTAAANAASSQ